MFRYTEKKLAKEIGAIARRLKPDLDATYTRDTQTIELHSVSDVDAAPYSIFLGNLLLKVCDMGRQQRRATLESFLGDVLTPKELSADELIASLALRVRTPFELDLRQRIIAIKAEPLDSVTFGNGELLLELVSDSEQSVASVSGEKLAEAGIDAKDAYKAAAATLVRATSGNQWTTCASNIWMSAYEDDYDFSRLVAAKEHGRLPFDGSPVLFAPSHSICLVTDEPDGDTLTSMIDQGNELAQNHRPFSQALWTRADGGDWIRWSPIAGEPGYHEKLLQDFRDRISQYSDQNQYLESLLQENGEDSFVASYQVFEQDDGLQSVSVYTLNLASYLPETDVVALVDPDVGGDNSMLGAIPWTDFESTLGADTLQRMTGLIPPVYKLTTKISPEQEARLRELVVSS